MDWYLMLTLCAIVFLCQMKTYSTKGWDMLTKNIYQLYLSMNQCWEYQSSTGLAILCVDYFSLGNCRKQNIQALRHKLHLDLWSYYIWILWVQLEPNLLEERDTS